MGYSMLSVCKRTPASAAHAGAGAQGEVYAAWWRGKPVAVKKFARAADAVHEVRLHVVMVARPASRGVQGCRQPCSKQVFDP